MRNRDKVIVSLLTLASVTQMTYHNNEKKYENDVSKVILGNLDNKTISDVKVIDTTLDTEKENKVFINSSDDTLKGEVLRNYEITTDAAVSIDELSTELLNLENKINEISTKVDQEKKNGINYAEERLSDLYLDQVCDNDNIKDLNRIIDEGRELISSKETNNERITDKITEIENCYLNLRKIETYSSFSGVNGEVWKDTNGVKIQAHGGQVQKIDGKWWWYGEDKTKGYRSNGISAYSSNDLYNWNFEGYVMRDLNNREQLDNDPYFSNLYKDYSEKEKDNVYLCINDSKSVIERPKVIYNEKTGKYVMWFHDDGPTNDSPGSNYAAAAAGVAISDSPNGPFKFIDRYRLNVCPEEDKKGEWYESSAGFARDMNLFVDDDGTAYIIYSSEENRTMFISKLNDDYTYLSSSVDDAIKGKDFVRLFPGAQREAPALFKYNNKYYLITSGATGWDPNEARYWTADEIFGEWTDKDDPCKGDNTNTTFKSQSTNVITVDEKLGKYIFMADRWNSNDLGDSRYVWLPLEFDWNGGLLIKPYTDWTIDDLNNKYMIKINTALNELYNNINDLPKKLNVSIYEDGELISKDVDVTWDIDDVLPLTKTTITGTLEGLDREISTDIILIPDNLKYYIDCGNTESDIYNMVNEKSKLINNEKCDQSYLDGTWGYTGIVGTDINYKNKGSNDANYTGWWAYGGKSIDYKMHLEGGKYKLFSGFYEWWNTSRHMQITLSYVDGDGKVVSEKLGDFTNKDQKTTEYEFSLIKSQDINISISKVSSNDPDPILSWLAVQSLDENQNNNQENNNSLD